MWQPLNTHDRCLISASNDRLVVLGLDGQGSWGLGREVEDALRRDLETTSEWTRWRDIHGASERLRGLAMDVGRRVAAKHLEEEEFNSTAVSGLLLLAEGGRVQVALAGIYEVCLLRDNAPIEHARWESPRLDEIRKQSPTKATAFDLMYDGNLLAEPERDDPMVASGPWTLLDGDELVIAKHHFFTGQYVGPPELAHLQHSDLDWSDVEFNSRETQVLRLAYRASPD